MLLEALRIGIFQSTLMSLLFSTLCQLWEQLPSPDKANEAINSILFSHEFHSFFRTQISQPLTITKQSYCQHFEPED